MAQSCELLLWNHLRNKHPKIMWTLNIWLQWMNVLNMSKVVELCVYGCVCVCVWFEMFSSHPSWVLNDVTSKVLALRFGAAHQTHNRIGFQVDEARWRHSSHCCMQLTSTSSPTTWMTCPTKGLLSYLTRTNLPFRSCWHLGDVEGRSSDRLRKSAGLGS